MKYICPGCDKEMIIAKLYGDVNTPPDYECLDCDLYYLTPYENVLGSLGLAKEDLTIIVSGDFDHCCRVYKLKAFW